MLRVEHLIKQIRRPTDNETVGTDQGMSDEEIISFLNDAQDDIFGSIVNTFKSKFTTSETTSIVANQSTYSTPSKAFMDDQIAMLEWSITGLERDYRALKRVTIREKNTVEGWPSRYCVARNLIYIWPVPIASQGTLRITYTKKLPKMDKRRAQVSASTIALGALTALTLKGVSGAAISTTEVAAFSNDDFLSIVSSDGTVLMENVEYTAVSALGVVTLAGASHTILTGETAPANAYVVMGKYATTHSELPDDAERYLKAYSIWKVYKRDSNDDYGPQQQELSAMREAIIDNYAELNADIDYTPQVNNYYDW
jgi:hypothetical protein